MALLLYVPFLSKLLNFHRLNGAELGVCLGAGLVSVSWFEFWKLANRRSGRRSREIGALTATGL